MTSLKLDLKINNKWWLLKREEDMVWQAGKFSFVEVKSLSFLCVWFPNKRTGLYSAKGVFIRPYGNFQFPFQAFPKL